MLRRQQPQPSARVVEAREAGKTNRTFARMDAAKRILPSLFGSTAAVLIALIESQNSAVNIVLAVMLGVLVPAGLAKILWDAGQKRRLRARLADLEQENRQLTTGRPGPQAGGP